MNGRRSLLLVLLIPLFGVFLVGATIGAVELGLWLALFVAWLVAFFSWGRPRAAGRRPT